MSVKLGYHQLDEATLQREVNALVALHSLYPYKEGDDCDLASEENGMIPLLYDSFFFQIYQKI